jgi:hypothetical protein
MATSRQPGTFGAVPEAQKRERRSCARVSVLAESQQAVFAELGPTRGLLLDVCGGGISVETVDAIEKGASLPVRFLLPFDHVLIQARCEVTWENNCRAGLKFLQLSGAEKHQLERWLKTHAKGTVGPRAIAIETPLQLPLEETAKGCDPVGAASSSRVVEPCGATSGIEPKVTKLGLPECDLARVVEEARSLTGADGAAIALRDERGVLCRASTGNAPSVGSRLRTESGLTGECFRSGEMVWCDDMDNDPRVDRANAKRLQSRSALILPIHARSSRGSTLGVIEVLSSRSSAFSYEHVAILHRLAKQISADVSATAATNEAEPQKQFLTSQQQSVSGLVSRPPAGTAKAHLESSPLPALLKTAPAGETLLAKGSDSESALKPEHTAARDVLDMIRRCLLIFR